MATTGSCLSLYTVDSCHRAGRHVHPFRNQPGKLIELDAYAMPEVVGPPC